jgi:hypothetical protein
VSRNNTVIEMRHRRKTGEEWLETGKACAEQGALNRAYQCFEMAVLEDPLLDEAYCQLRDVENEIWRQRAKEQRRRHQRAQRAQKLLRAALLLAVLIVVSVVLSSTIV